MGIKDIKGLTAPGFNNDYQDLIRDAVYKAILEATMDPETRQAYLRNEDVVHALLDLQALFASTSGMLSSPTKLREYSVAFGKRFRTRVAEMQAANAASIADHIINAGDKN